MAGIIGSMLAGAAESFGSGMGKLGSASILEDQKAQIEAERDKRLQEFTMKRDETLRAGRNEDTIAAEERGITNAPRMQSATLPGEKAKAEMISGVEVERHKKTSKIDSAQKIADEKEMAPFRREQKQQDALAVAETAKTLAADPAYLKAQQALTAASENSATRASAADHMMNIAVNRVKLEQQNNIAKARAGYETAVKSGDQDGISKAKKALDATMYDNNADKAHLTATAGVIRTLESSINTMEARKAAAGTQADQDRIQREIDTSSRELKSFVADFKERTGVKTPTIESPKPTAKDWADLRERKTNPAAVRSFAARFGVDEKTLLEKMGPQPGGGLIDSGQSRSILGIPELTIPESFLPDPNAPRFRKQ